LAAAAGAGLELWFEGIPPSKYRSVLSMKSPDGLHMQPPEKAAAARAEP
jgi:hypothetical protein